MTEQNNIIRGIKPLDQQKNDLDEDAPKDDNTKIFKIPDELFEDYKDINEHNEDMFVFIAYNLVIEYLETACLRIKTDDEAASPVNRYKDTKWETALEFPEVIPTMGRSLLHEVANFFDLSHHTTGRAQGKHRRFVVYPKTLFVEKQERERMRLLNERIRLRDKYNKKDSFTGIFPDHPQTFTEMVLREIHDEKFKRYKDGQSYDHVPKDNYDYNPRIITTNMINASMIGKAPYPSEIEKLISKKRQDLERLVNNIEKKHERDKKKLKELEENMEESGIKDIKELDKKL